MGDRESLIVARLDDGSTVEIRDATCLSDVDAALEYGHGSVGGSLAKEQGYRYFAEQWWLPTTRGIVPLSRVVEFVVAGDE